MYGQPPGRLPRYPGAPGAGEAFGVEKPQRRVVDKPTLAGKGTMKWLMNIFALILTTGVLAVLLWHQWDFPISATEKLPIVVFQLSAFMAGYTCCVWILSRKR